MLFRCKIRKIKQFLEIVSDSALKQEFPNFYFSNFWISFIVEYSEIIIRLTFFLTTPISTPYMSVGTFCVLCIETNYRKNMDPESD